MATPPTPRLSELDFDAPGLVKYAIIEPHLFSPLPGHVDLQHVHVHRTVAHLEVSISKAYFTTSIKQPRYSILSNLRAALATKVLMNSTAHL